MTEDELVTLERQGWHALSAHGEAARAFYDGVLDEAVVMLLPGGMVLDGRETILESMSGSHGAATRWRTCAQFGPRRASG